MDISVCWLLILEIPEPKYYSSERPLSRANIEKFLLGVNNLLNSYIICRECIVFLKLCTIKKYKHKMGLLHEGKSSNLL